MAGVLTGPEIETRFKNGEILIYPYRGFVGPNSYDVSLGPYFWRMRGESSLYIISNEQSIQDNWALERAKKWEDILQDLIDSDLLKYHEIERFSEMIDMKQEIILIEPGELILAHTIEYIGSIGDVSITTEMKARSSAGRSGISVCKCAGMGDPGYCTRWTMEIKNEGKKIIPLLVGSRLAQIVFITTVGEVIPYTRAGSHYQTDSKILDKIKISAGGSDEKKKYITEYIGELTNSWKPQMMLPSAHALE